MRVSQFVVAVRKAISGVGEDALLTRAAAIAFYSALSFAPLIVLLLWVLAALRPEWQGQLTDGLASMLGEKAAGAITLVLQNAESQPTLGNIAGILNEGRNVLGMMPHPDRSSEQLLGSADGWKIFESMVSALATR